MAYDKGDKVQFQVTFTDLDGTETDPTTIVCKVKDPSGNVATYTYGVDANVGKTSVGVYTCDVDIDESGTWYYRWTGVGTLVAAEEASIAVKRSKVI